MVKTKYPGVYVYKQKNRDVSFYVVFRSAGVQRWVLVGKRSEGVSAKKAFDFKSEMQLKNRSSKLPKSEVKLTLNDLAKHYFRVFRKINSSNKHYKYLYESYIKPEIGKVKIRDLKNSDILKLQNKYINSLSAGSVNLLLKLVKRVINFAIRDELIKPKIINFKMLKESERVRYLSLEEIEQLKEIVRDDERVYLFVLIALSTGARVNSILSLRYKDIDFENKSISLYDFKRKSYYIGYLDAEVEQLLKRREFSKKDLVVDINYSNLYARLRKAFNIFNKGVSKKDRANRVVIHTLRHTFASHLALNGVPIQRIQKLLNHKNINITLRYAKLSPDSGRIEVENLYKCKG